MAQKGLVSSKSQYVVVHATASVKIGDETIIEGSQAFHVVGSSPVGPLSAVAGPSTAPADAIRTIPLYLVNEKNGYVNQKRLSVKGKVVRMTDDLRCTGYRKRKVTIRDDSKFEMEIQIFNATVEEFVANSPIGHDFLFNNLQVNIYQKQYTLQQISSKEMVK